MKNPIGPRDSASRAKRAVRWSIDELESGDRVRERDTRILLDLALTEGHNLPGLGLQVREPLGPSVPADNHNDSEEHRKRGAEGNNSAAAVTLGARSHRLAEGIFRLGQPPG